MGDVLRVVRHFLSPLVEDGRRTVVFLGLCCVYKMHVYGACLCMCMHTYVFACVCTHAHSLYV